MKNIFKLIILILIFTQSQNVFAEFRDVETSAIIGDIPVVEANKNQQAPSIAKNTIQDNNKKLYGMVGKSQILKIGRAHV